MADLDHWQYAAPNGCVLIDPERGRIVFPPRQLPKQGVSVYYQYGFSANIGGGEYQRLLSQPADARLYLVGRDGDYPTINAALAMGGGQARHPGNHGAAPTLGAARKPVSAVIEITDSAVYTERIVLALSPYESLQIRAANGRRPTIRLLNYMTSKPDALAVSGGRSSRLTLDGLLVTGRGLQMDRRTPVRRSIPLPPPPRMAGICAMSPSVIARSCRAGGCSAIAIPPGHPNPALKS